MKRKRIISGQTPRWMILLLISLFWSSFLSNVPSSSKDCSGRSIGFAAASIVKPSDNDEVLEKSNEDSSISKENRRLEAWNEILIRAGKRGLGGGIPGAIAGFVQVLSLMWLRTIINYQSRYGTSFVKSLSVLYNEGGIGRLYRGVSFALFQAPLSRFVSTAANDGVEALLAGLEFTSSWGVGRSTVVASIVVGFWRMMLMPLDTCKTVLQVDSKEGFRNLMRRVRAGKIGVLYSGCVANALSSMFGHYPWFYTYNVLSQNEWLGHLLPSKLIRNAAIGLYASVVSDTVVNAFRVVKTTKQAISSKHDLSYLETIRMVLAADGWKGLFGRGLKTRVLANSLQSIVFTIIWRGLSDRWSDQPSEGDQSNIRGGKLESTTDKN